jgi:Putative restriction endonuclease
MQALPIHPPRDTGPIELRSFGPTRRRLGTPDDCYDGSRWELHRGELVEQMGCMDIHGITIARLAALFCRHVRAGSKVMLDVYCDLSDAEGPSLRAPDVTIVRDLSEPRNEVYRGTPVIAVEVRGTQSKRYLEEKVKLYLEHDWPVVWIAHVERREVEVIRSGMAPVTYRLGAEVPAIAELDKHGLARIPVAAFFDDRAAALVNDEWVEARGEARGRAAALFQVLDARGIHISDAARARIAATTDAAVLDRWLGLAITSASAEAFIAALG